MTTYPLSNQISDPLSAVPQSIGARVELEQLMSVKKNFITPQSNRPVMGVVQDSLLGSYLLTRRGTFLTKDEFMNALMHVENWDGRIPQPAVLHPQPLWTGKQLFSLVLPAVDYGPSPGMTPDDSVVMVRKGSLVTGTLTKRALGRSYNSLLHVVWKRFGHEAMASALNAIQRVVDHWMTQHSFSTGIGDCARTAAMANDVVPTALRRVASTLKEHRRHAGNPLVEAKVNEILNAARDTAGAYVLARLPPDHGMRCMAAAGSKGSLINMCQIASCVGQQNVNGKRPAFTPSSNRTLPHFHKWDNGPAARGFVQNSYYDGLSPSEFWFHAAAGREGIIASVESLSESSHRFTLCLCLCLSNTGHSGK